MFQRAANPEQSLPRNPRQTEGLALLGLTALMAFLVIVLVAVVVVASWVRQSGKEQLTRRTLNALAGALIAYNQATGEFPPTVASNTQLLDQLDAVPLARKAIQAMPPHVFRTTAGGKEILDAWSRPLSYVFDPAAKRPELVSKGPDAEDPADDLYAQGLRSKF